MNIQNFILVTAEKVDRALNGSQVSGGEVKGGVGHGAYQEGGVWKKNGKPLSEAEVEKLEAALLAEYDKLGGLIMRGDDKVQTGSFWDIKAGTPREKPQVSFVFRVNGREIVVPDGQELPGQVKAQKIAEQSAAEEAGDEDVEEKKPKAKKGKK